jgi:hypothetical protein
MKTLTRAIAIGALASGSMMAQRPFGVLSSTSAPDPATMVQNQVDRLTKLLSLSSSQVTEATTIFTNALTAVTPLQTTLNTDWQSLQTAVKGNAVSTIDQLSTSIGTLTGQITDIQNRADAAFYAILTSTQQATLSSSGGFGAPGGGPGPGGPRGRP